MKDRFLSSVCVCVCGECLNRRKTSHLFYGFSFWISNLVAGRQSHVCSWLPNEEGCIHDWYDSGMLESRTCDFNFSSVIAWQGAKPRTPTHRFCMVAQILYGRRNLRTWSLFIYLFIYLFVYLFIYLYIDLSMYVFIFFSFTYLSMALFGTSFEHVSPTFRTQGMDDKWKPLVRASESRTSLYLTLIPGITSWWTPLTLYRFCFACMGFCSRRIQLRIRFLSSVCVTYSSFNALELASAQVTSENEEDVCSSQENCAPTNIERCAVQDTFNEIVFAYLRMYTHILVNLQTSLLLLCHGVPCHDVGANARNNQFLESLLLATTHRIIPDAADWPCTYAWGFRTTLASCSQFGVGFGFALPGLSRPALVRTSRLAERCLANSRCCGSHCHCGKWRSEDLQAVSRQP